MISRVALYNLVAQRGLERHAAAELWRIAGFTGSPPTLPRLLKRWTSLAAAGLVGMGLILAVAANWQSMGKAQQFGLLQALVVLPCAGAALLPAARAPFGMLGFLAIGGLFAFFGQTYQTGADPWQLFALWAGLGIWLAVCARSDSVWCAWIVVALLAISLRDPVWSGHAGLAGGGHLATLCAAALPPLLASKALRTYTGAGMVAWRFAITLSAVVVTVFGIASLQDGLSLPYWLGLALAAVAAFAVASPRRFDVYVASIAGLAVNILLDAGLVELLFSHSRGEEVGKLMAMALAAAGLLAGTVRLIMLLSRNHSEAEGA
jgi:uncharacterized membrane protein